MFKFAKSLSLMAVVGLMTATSFTPRALEHEDQLIPQTVSQQPQKVGSIVFEDYVRNAFNQELLNSGHWVDGELDLSFVRQIICFLKAIPEPMFISLLLFAVSLIPAAMFAMISPLLAIAVVCVIFIFIIAPNWARMSANKNASIMNKHAQEKLYKGLSKVLTKKFAELYELQENGYEITSRSTPLRLFLKHILASNINKQDRLNCHYTALRLLECNNDTVACIATMLKGCQA